ncbi:hypothetical protein HID58_090809 [Brassica napus]|uniref:Uncharacterized protein n=1 Tax=Brassica napus TaxID=3708 RepID=A0ABQ7X939_BRANA|nr:hypothetical protein HID58_090809 [Brassica napus]
MILLFIELSSSFGFIVILLNLFSPIPAKIRMPFKLEFLAPMADHRMSIDDEWKTSGELLWTFLIDKEHLTNVLKEFFSSTDAPQTEAVSYWPPTTKELATRFKYSLWRGKPTDSNTAYGEENEFLT